MLLKIGQLARQTGLTVRTLHHYDAIGVLRPSGRADNGYRTYDRADVARLHQLQALRRLGLGLEEAGALLDGGALDIAGIVARQVEQLNAQIEHATLLRDRLVGMQQDFATDAEPDLKEWLTTLELMAILDKYLTPDEMAQWRAHNRDGRRREQVDARNALFADIKAMMRDGVPPDAPAALDAARRWIDLTDPHVKRDPGLMLKMDVMYREDATIQSAIGADADLLDFVTRAAAHYRLGLYERHLEPAQFASIRTHYLNQPFHDWIVLCRDLHAFKANGTPPDDPAVGAVCARWRSLFDACFGDDPDVRARVLHAQATDPLIGKGSTWDAALRTYLREGLSYLDAREASHA